MIAVNTISQKQQMRPREDVLAASRLNTLGNDVCRLMLMLRDKLNCFDEGELRRLLREDLNRTGHDSELTMPEDIWVLDIIAGVKALEAMLPLIHEKIHSETLPVPKELDAWWS